MWRYRRLWQPYRATLTYRVPQKISRIARLEQKLACPQLGGMVLLIVVNL